MSKPEATRYKRPESVLVVVYTRKGTALLLRRADHPEFWQSVTGSMEWNDEAPIDAAVRELREETGIRAAPEALRDWRMNNRYVLFPQWRHKYAPGVTENIEHTFSLEIADECAIDINLGEHCEYLWAPMEDAAQRVFSWTNRDALIALINARHGPACVRSCST